MTVIRASVTGLAAGVAGATAWCIWLVLAANARDAATRAAHDDWHAHRYDVFGDDDD